MEVEFLNDKSKCIILSIILQTDKKREELGDIYTSG